MWDSPNEITGFRPGVGGKLKITAKFPKEPWKSASLRSELEVRKVRNGARGWGGLADVCGGSGSLGIRRHGPFSESLVGKSVIAILAD
jgi:hypothetical protein